MFSSQEYRVADEFRDASIVKNALQRWKAAQRRIRVRSGISLRYIHNLIET